MKVYMALSCKVGAYNRVLDELIKMNLSKNDVFLLFGPVDILIQLCGLKKPNEFINKWFNPIRTITPEEPMIEKTQTLIVISEGRAFKEEPYAFLFLILSLEISKRRRNRFRTYEGCCQRTRFLEPTM